MAADVTGSKHSDFRQWPWDMLIAVSSLLPAPSNAIEFIESALCQHLLTCNMCTGSLFSEDKKTGKRHGEAKKHSCKIDGCNGRMLIELSNRNSNPPMHEVAQTAQCAICTASPIQPVGHATAFADANKMEDETLKYLRHIGLPIVEHRKRDLPGRGQSQLLKLTPSVQLVLDL